MPDTNTPAPVTPVPAPTAQQHFNLARLLSIVEHLGAFALTVAPVVIAPFVHNPQSQAILAAETPIAAALAQELGAMASGAQQ